MAGCGGDDEAASDTTPELPKLTVPRTDTEPDVTIPPDTETVAPPATEPVPPADDGGTTAPTETAPPADSPENDAPPPSDSPAERFEEFCNENPGACG